MAAVCIDLGQLISILQNKNIDWATVHMLGRENNDGQGKQGSESLPSRLGLGSYCCARSQDSVVAQPFRLRKLLLCALPGLLGKQ